MPSTTNDSDLVAAYRAGDRGALASIYDRYGDTLYDTAAAMVRDRHDAADITQDVFVVAAERLSQLRDPSRLKPWLFAILRNEVYRRTGKRRRTVPTDFTEPVAEMTLPPDSADEASDLEFQELADLVRRASFGLDERDQLVLELSVRHGLQGDDLAAALGVTPQQCYGLVHRMRQRTERSLGAYCVARASRKECAELTEILGGWDGEFSVLIRKRVARHVDGCEICEPSRRKVLPFALFGAAPAFAAPADLRDRVLAAAGRGTEPGYAFTAPGGFPQAVKYARRLGVWMILATLALLIAGGATMFVLAANDGDRLATVDSTTTTTDGPLTLEPTPAGTSPADAGAVAASGGPTTVNPLGGSPTATSTTVVDSTGAAPTSDPIVANLPPIPTTPPASTLATITTVLPSATSTPVVASGAPTTLAATSPTTSTPAGSATTTTSGATTTTTTSGATTTTSVATTTTTTTTPPGELALSSSAIDFGQRLSEVSITLTNTGGRSVQWSSTTGPAAFRGGGSPFAVTPGSGGLAAGESVDVVVSFNRKWPIEGPVKTTNLTFFADRTSAAIALDAEIARPPVITPIRIPPDTACPIRFPFFSIAATIADESSPVRGLFEIFDPSGARRSTATTVRGSDHAASIDADGDGDSSVDVGRWSWRLTATDAFVNSSSVSGTTDVQTIHC
jgi:RNA polymerase sigma factor (sigma-70 family)